MNLFRPIDGEPLKSLSLGLSFWGFLIPQKGVFLRSFLGKSLLLGRLKSGCPLSGNQPGKGAFQIHDIEAFTSAW